MKNSSTQSRADLIETLAQDITPVSRVKPQHGAFAVGAATLSAGLLSIAVFGVWSGLINGTASGYFWITNGLLAMLGAASTAALVAGASPRVGTRTNTPVWGMAMVGVLPVAGLLSAFSGVLAESDISGAMYWYCSLYGLAAALAIAIAAIVFLRRGAPVSLERAGWTTGIAAGSLGSLAYGITCPLDGLSHVGIVHIIPVAIAAVIGRIAVPPLIRW